MKTIEVRTQVQCESILNDTSNTMVNVSKKLNKIVSDSASGHMNLIVMNQIVKSLHDMLNRLNGLFDYIDDTIAYQKAINDARR